MMWNLQNAYTSTRQLQCDGESGSRGSELSLLTYLCGRQCCMAFGADYIPGLLQNALTIVILLCPWTSIGTLLGANKGCPSKKPVKYPCVQIMLLLDLCKYYIIVNIMLFQRHLSLLLFQRIYFTKILSLSNLVT